MGRGRWFSPGSFPYFVSAQLWHSDFPEPTQSFHGQTVIVTGSNVGLGKEAAKHIARLGAAKLILAVRTLSKGEAAKQEIEAAIKGSPTIIEVWQLDLGNTESVKQFAARANKELERIDILLENAAVATGEFKLVEGEENTIKTNVISTFLLAFLLLPKMKQTASDYNTRPTLTIVSSEVHFWAKFPEKSAPDGKILDTLNVQGQGNFGERYPLSKLLEVLLVRKIVSLHPNRLIDANAPEDYPVTINLVNPGLCHSELARERGKWSPLQLFKLAFARSTEIGSRTLVDAVSSGPVTHGVYLSECEPSEISTFSRSNEGAKTGDRLYEELLARLEKQSAGCTANL